VEAGRAAWVGVGADVAEGWSAGCGRNRALILIARGRRGQVLEAGPAASGPHPRRAGAGRWRRLRPPVAREPGRWRRPGGPLIDEYARKGRAVGGPATMRRPEWRRHVRARRGQPAPDRHCLRRSSRHPCPERRSRVSRRPSAPRWLIS